MMPINILFFFIYICSVVFSLHVYRFLIFFLYFMWLTRSSNVVLNYFIDFTSNLLVSLCLYFLFVDFLQDIWGARLDVTRITFFSLHSINQILRYLIDNHKKYQMLYIVIVSMAKCSSALKQEVLNFRSLNIKRFWWYFLDFGFMNWSSILIDFPDRMSYC